MTSMQSNFSPKNLAQALDEAGAIVLGAGAGLSVADGHPYGGTWFQEHFADFAQAYGLTDAYTAGFYPFPSQEEKWGFWSRMILHNRYLRVPGQVYQNLLNLLAGKNYFVLTTNVDHFFQKAGFEKDHLYYMQGDFGLFQCSVPCHQQTYDNQQMVEAMVTSQRGRAVASEFLPVCPRCGEPMTTNLRIDQTFVQDTGWYAAEERYRDFLASSVDQKTLFLELGVGANTPGIIKYPFWQMVHQHPSAVYAAVGLEAGAPAQLADKSLIYRQDIAQVLQDPQLLPGRVTES